MKKNCQTFTLLTQCVHFNTCPSHFKLLMIPSQIVGLHFELLLKKNMLMELCDIKWLHKWCRHGTFEDYT